MIDELEVLLEVLSDYGPRLAIALLCGGLLGIERERKDKPAGLRTIVLIALGSALFMIVSTLLPSFAEGPETITRVDSSRVAAGVVSGIGFLGAGAIIQARGAVHGLTTAAVIWVAAGVGLCAGLGLYVLALLCTLAALGTLILMDPLRLWLTRIGKRHAVEFMAPDDSLVLQRIEEVLEQHGVRRSEITVHPAGDEVRIATFYYTSGSTSARLLTKLSRIEGVHGTRRFEA